MDLIKAGLIVQPFLVFLLLASLLSGNIESTANNVTPVPQLTNIFDTNEKACQTETINEKEETQNEIAEVLQAVDFDTDVDITVASVTHEAVRQEEDAIVKEESSVESEKIAPTSEPPYEVFPQNITEGAHNNSQTIFDWKLVFLKNPRSMICYKDDQPSENISSSTLAEKDAFKDEAPKHDIFESFEEWKKNKLVEAETKKSDDVSQDLDESRPTYLRKQHKLVNYASQDCGAKILDHNKEAKHVFAILDENKDLYMLNPCSSDIWFVIELCEPIQVQTIHLSNLELFSSSPNEFTISVSERYPTREWKVLDRFTAKNQRNLQVFHHEGDNQMFAKYIKFRMLSHFGNEHFCPITMVRVFGISMVEVYDSQEQDKEEEDLTKETPVSEPEEGTFDAVLNIVKTAIGIDTAPKKDEMKSEENATNDDTLTVDNNTKQNDNDSVLWQSSVELVENITSESLVVLVKTGDGESIAHDQFYNIPICSNAFIRHFSPIAETVNTHMCWFIEFVCKISLASCLLPSNVNGTEFNSLAEYFNFKNLHRNSTQISSAVEQQISLIEDKVKNVNIIKDDIKVMPKTEQDIDDSQPIANKQLGNIEQDQEASDNTATEPLTIETPPNVNNKKATSDIIEKVPPVNNDTAKVNSSDSAVKTEQLEPNKTTATPLDKNQSSSEPLVINPGSNQKESVFMRLSNRIRILEQNMTLSSDYLENLSQRYKKQVDELQKAFNSTVNKLIETSKTADDNDKKQTELIHLAEKELEQLSQELSDLAKSGEALNRHLIERHLLLILLEIVVFISLLFVFVKKHDRKVKENLNNVESKMKQLESMLTKYDALLKHKIENEIPKNGKNTGKKKSPKNRRSHENANNIISRPETLFGNGSFECSTDPANFKQGDFVYDTNHGLISDQTKDWVECNDKLLKSRK